MSKVKDAKKFLILRTGLIWVIFLVLVIFSFNLIQRYKIGSSEFIIKEVKVFIDDNKELSGRDGFKYLNLDKDISIFKIKPKNFSQTILKIHPEAKEVEVYKKMPSRLEIRVKNRIPLAGIHLTQFYPLDDKGFILPFPSNFRIDGYPNIEGIRIEEVTIGAENSNLKLTSGLKLVNMLATIFDKNYYHKIDIDVTDVKNIILILPEDIKVKLGSDRFEEKLLRLKLVLDDIRAKNLKPSFVDLRFEKVILGPK